MANLHNVKSNRWSLFAAHLAEDRLRYGRDDMLLRIVSLMEMAYAQGLQDGRDDSRLAGQARDRAPPANEDDYPAPRRRG